MVKLNSEVSEAIANCRPVVALESTVISHGLPYPENLETALSVERIVREHGAVPATIAVFDGEFCAGLSRSQLEKLAAEKGVRKISRRDLAIAHALKLNCATTVSTTSFIAHRAGIKVFATGGIGGVHRGFAADVSADLPELAQTPIVVVCSGGKIILDLPATREWLETNGVAVLGWRCDEMPAFYSRKSGLEVDQRIENAEEAARIARARDELEIPSAVLVTVPVPPQFEVDKALLDTVIHESLDEAEKLGIRGKDLTPFLLGRLSEHSRGKTLAANIALLKNNAKVAAEIAKAISDGKIT